MATRDAILEAAISEFIERGFAGVRMEHVARRAGFNKALVYRWFKDKETLFQEAMTRRFSQRSDLLDNAPEDLTSLLAWWSEQSLRDPEFMRMILREALDARDQPPVHAAFRQAYYRRQIDLVRRLQAEGSIDPAFDAEMLFVALLAVVTLTTALPQIVELATGAYPRSARFRKRWVALLNDLAAHLGPRPTGPRRRA
jgi:AcrR family transcriptional regulator